MRRVLLAALATAAIGLASMAAPASAGPVLVLVDDGITYSLTLTSVANNGLTGNFTLAISGINTALDTEGGRTGINAFAFNDAASAVSGTSSGFTFQSGGLSQGGCDGSGTGFFCFKATSAAFPTPLPMESLFFSVTNTTGNWANWTPDFKIDWTGTMNKKGNYDLVSKAIPLNVTPPVPEPATWALMLLGFGGIGMSMRRREANGRLLQIA